MNSTIVALSTARGTSAIAVVRMSGDDAIEIAKKVFSPFPKQPNMLRLGTIRTEHFDEHAMCVYFVAPHSYTGENSVEFHCHGGTAVPQAVIEACLENGAVMAQNGEFSKRAFINGKQNLTNAEGIIEMINAETASAAKAGANLLENKLGKRVVALQDALLDLLSACEAALDYPEEDLELPTVEQVNIALKQIDEQLSSLISTTALGKIAKNGIDVAILGAPNVGKSSLLNALLGTDRAIVSQIEGTTRDILTESVIYKDIKFNFIDTAGLRQTTDEIEEEGIRRAHIAAQNADVILFVVDNDHTPLTLQMMPPIVTIFNKSDLYTIHDLSKNQLSVSAKYGDVEPIKQHLYDMFNAGDIASSDLLITNERHLSCLKKAQEQTRETLCACNTTTLDIVANGLRDIWDSLGQITGTNASEDIIDRIYSKFCLGK